VTRNRPVTLSRYDPSRVTVTAVGRYRKTLRWCPVCGEPARTDLRAVYCSPACRQRAYRFRKRQLPVIMQLAPSRRRPCEEPRPRPKHSACIPEALHPVFLLRFRVRWVRGWSTRGQRVPAVGAADQRTSKGAIGCTGPAVGPRSRS
jgi:predicted nucleic acid-binding Zn ribbon protein